MNRILLHFLVEVADLPLNLNIWGINTDIISIIEPQIELIRVTLFHLGIIILTLTNIIIRANHIVKYCFFPMIPKIMGDFVIFNKIKIEKNFYPFN